MGTEPVFLCDLYNTLVQERDYTRFLATLEREVGLSLDLLLPVYRKNGRLSMTGAVDGMRGRLAKTLDSLGTSISPRHLLEISRAVENAYVDCVALYDDTLLTLKTLSRMGTVCVVSNASSYSHVVLERLGISSYMYKIFLSCDIGVMKPDQEIYRRVLSDLGVSGKDCLFIGDGEHDELLGAKGFGMRTILVDRRLAHTSRARNHADHVISELAGAVKLAAAFDLARTYESN